MSAFQTSVSWGTTGVNKNLGDHCVETSGVRAGSRSKTVSAWISTLSSHGRVPPLHLLVANIAVILGYILYKIYNF
jgi:hypothetical protein